MTRRLAAALALVALAVGTAAAQDARTVLQAASTALGAGNLKTVQYSGTGWNAAMGQSFRSDADWPRFEVTRYTRAIDYDARSSSESRSRAGKGPIPLRAAAARRFKASNNSTSS